MDRVIWMDAEAYNGRGIKDPENDHEYNTTEYHTGPENKRECPCDTCPLFDQCADAKVLSVVRLGIGVQMVTIRTLMSRGY